MIQAKEKPCRGIGKAIGQKGCRKPTLYRKYGLCSTCLSDFMLKTDLGKVIFSKQSLKVSNVSQKNRRPQNAPNALKSIPDLLESVQVSCHKYIRERDKWKPCISCEKPWSKTFQAGHYYPAGKYSLLRFNEYQINGQCKECNLMKEGNFKAYGLNLIKKIGNEMFFEILKIAGKEKKIVHSWDRESLIEIEKYYKTKLKNMTV